MPSMAEIEFSINLPANAEKLFKIATDYERYTKFFEGYLQSVKVIEKSKNKTHTEEIFQFKIIFNHEIVQESIHTVSDSKKIHTEVVKGPFKGSVIDIVYESHQTGTKVIVNADYKIALKYKIISPIIKQKYRIILTGLLYKMNTIALNDS